MTGMNPFEENMITQIADNLSDRDKALFFLGLTTGLRISEMLSLKVKDVYSNGKVKSSLYIEKKNTKKKIEGKSKAIVEPAFTALTQYLSNRNILNGDEPLFLSRKAGQSINRRTYFAILKKACIQAGIDSRVGTHSMRKTYAKKVYEVAEGDYMQCKLMLNHKSLSSTESYLQFVKENEITNKLRWSF